MEKQVIQYDQEKDLPILNSLDMREVMRLILGVKEERESDERVYYLCPFHDDHEPSFSITKSTPGGRTFQCYFCHPCGDKGRGEGCVNLVQKWLKEVKGITEGVQQEAVRLLATTFGVKLHRPTTPVHFEEFTDEDYRDCNDRYNRYYSSTRKTSFSEKDLEALGIKDAEQFGGINKVTYVLHKQFNCYAILNCKYESNSGKLYNSWSLHEYPMFEFEYEGGNVLRKYEPYFTSEDKSNYKNTLYKDNSVNIDTDALVFGDQEILDILRNVKHDASDFNGLQQRSSRQFVDTKRLLVDEETGKMKMQRVKVIKSIIICSGQRDAINVYLHSDSHVVYPQSETSTQGLSRKFITDCLWIADRVYVCFDADAVGKRAQNALCLRHLELRPINLPSDLCEIKNHRNGNKPCKDITEYFNLYCAKHGYNPTFRLRQLMRQAKDLKFWNTRVQRHRTEEQGEYTYESKYEFDAMSLARFLDANGFMGVWGKNANGVDVVQGYAHVGPYHCDDYELQPNQVKIIQLSDGLDYAINIIQHFFHGYNLTDEESENLENALITQRKLSEGGFRQLVSHALLDIFYWTDNSRRKADKARYLFFKNKAMKVTKDKIGLVNYKDLPFMVNKAQVADFDIHTETDEIRKQILQVHENPEYEERLTAYQVAMKLRNESPEQRMQITKEFTEFERMWRFISENEMTPTENCFPIVQIARNGSRIYWKKEEDGYTLTDEEKQTQMLYELNLMNSLGYLLDRYRTKGHIEYVLYSDYDVINENKSSGGTGKSTWRDALDLVTPVFRIVGKTMKTGESFAKNFENYVHGKHSLIGIDDWNEKLDGECMNGVEDGLDVRAVYQNMQHIDFEVTPKWLITTNKMRFDVTHPSTFRRMYLCLFSNYYHPEDSSGSIRLRDYETEFGHDPIKDASVEELNAIGWFFGHCIQTYLNIGKPLRIPVDEKVLSRTASAGIKEGSFINWAKQWFEDDCHFARPIAVREMQLSYAQWVGADLMCVKVHAGIDQFIQNLETYAHNAGVQVLGWESAIVRGNANRRGRFPDRMAWVTQQQDGRYITGLPRVKQQVGCLYLYRSKDKMPRHFGDLPKCGDIDPETIVNNTTNET